MAGGNKKNQQKSQVRNDSKDFNTFMTALFYCLLVLFLPLIAFWTLKFIVFEEYFHLDTVKGNIYSAAGAVITLHIALGIYIYRAYFDTPSGAPQDKKQD